MADVFVSYAREDRLRAAAVAEMIAARGWSVWGDWKITPGQSFSEVIEQELTEARCVVVLWSRSSVAAEWVLTEASEGARRRILIPAMLDNVPLPLEFRRRHAADLTAWSPQVPSAELDLFLDSISSLLPHAVDAGKRVPRSSVGQKRNLHLKTAIGWMIVALGILSVSQPPNETTKPPRHDPGATYRACSAEHDAVALYDIYRAYGDDGIDLSTFRRSKEWSSDWELRFADGSHEGKRVRVYHVTNRHICDSRFVLRWEAGQAAPDAWEAVTRPRA